VLYHRVLGAFGADEEWLRSMAFNSLRNFARFAPSRADKLRLVEIRTTDMTAADANWWDAHLRPHHSRMATRADRNWRWSVLLPMSHLVQLAKRRFCRPLVFWARADNGQFVRAGMSILIEEYPHLDINDPGDSDFLWFISAADSEVLSAHFGVSDPPALGRVLIDSAIVLSQNSGFLGRIGLHAAKKGGANLLTVYGKCGLKSLPATALLPSAISRKNDGRFFYADEPTAEALAELLDHAR
jgi:hypothetical protein